MALPPLSSTSPSSWRYTAEGGANLVLSFDGPSESPYSGRALRLRKRKKRTVKVGEQVNDEIDTRFGTRVIEPILGSEQVVQQEKGSLARDWQEQLVRQMTEDHVRPLERELEDEVDLHAGEAVIVEDLVGGKDIIAVEIKPKWGFLPSANRLSPSTSGVKTSFCRFCMHRYAKRFTSSGPLSPADVSAALDEHQKGYCPMDLYSTDAQRRERAVEALYAGWIDSQGEGNSLRFFLNGRRLSPADPDDVCELNAALQRLHPAFPHGNESSDLSPALSSLFASTVSTALLTSPLLPNLRHLQRTLDPLDIEGLASLLALNENGKIDLFSPSVDLSALGEQPSSAEWAEWMERYLPKIQSAPSPPPSCSAFSSVRLDKREVAARAFLTPSSTSPTTENPLRDAILAYLLSATFKDCSIILRFPLQPPDCPPSSPSSPSRSPAPAQVGSQISIKAIDLDPKPLKRLGKYAKMDREIVEKWKGFLEGLSGNERKDLRRCTE
ncbi:hypothetical protein JCM11641_000643 [Rhodosporidiobolus odoratus]